MCQKKRLRKKKRHSLLQIVINATHNIKAVNQIYYSLKIINFNILNIKILIKNGHNQLNTPLYLI